MHNTGPLLLTLVSLAVVAGCAGQSSKPNSEIPKLETKKWTPIIGQRYKCIPLPHAAILIAWS